MIKFQAVSKRYVTKNALHDVTLTLPKGRIVGVVGENGSGKSTMLKLMSGLLRPSKGRVFINDVEVDRKISESVAYLSELDAYYPFYTVGDHVDFFASQFFDFNKEKANRILQFMNLDADAKVKTLSKGNRGRLKIVLTLARAVPVILMDEPFSGLDPMVRESIVSGLISFINLENQTVIITTHEIHEIEPLLDTVVLIRNGDVLSVRDVEDIRKHDELSIVDWMKKEYAK